MNGSQLIEGLTQPGLKGKIPPQALRFFCDSGHGWLEAPVALLKRLGIANRISDCSYVSQDGKTAYLEEDCDAGVLAQELKAHGVALQIKELPPASGDSFVRNLPRFRA